MKCILISASGLAFLIQSEHGTDFPICFLTGVECEMPFSSEELLSSFG
jgi:hypothetical protein